MPFSGFLCKKIPCCLLHLYLFLWFRPTILVADEWVTRVPLKVAGGNLSYDEKILAYLTEENGRRNLMIKYLNDPDVGIAVSDVSGEIDSPSWSRDHRKIVFSKKEGGVSKIFLKDLKSKETPKQITFGSSEDFHPVFSSDDQWLAYDSNESGNFDIWMIHLKSGEKKRITNYSNHDFYPGFSPDGNYLVYTSFRQNTFNLFMKNLKVANSQPVQLTQEDKISAHPSFTSDGKGIIFDSNRSGSNRIYYFDLSNYETFFVTNPEEGNCSFPFIINNTLIYQAEKEGVFGLKTRNFKIENLVKWKNEERETRKELVQKVISELKDVNQAPGDFESDYLKIKEEKSLGFLPATTQSDTVFGFEKVDFSLDFLEKKNEPEVEGILVGKSSTPIGSNENQILEEIKNPVLQIPENQKTPKNLEQMFAQNHSTGLNLETPMNSKKDQVEQFFQPRMPEFIKTVLPVENATEVELWHPVAVIFNRDLWQGEEDFLNAKIYEGETLVEASANYVRSQKRLDIIPASPLKPGNEYRVIAGRASWKFKTKGSSSVKNPSKNQNAAEEKKEFTGLKAHKMFPMPKSTGVQANSPIRVQFTQKIDPQSVGPGSLVLLNKDGVVPGELVFEEGDQILTLRPYKNLEEAKIYEVRISPDLRSVSGEKYSDNDRYRFKTGWFSPFLITRFPPSILDHPMQPIEVELNRAVHPDSVNSEEFFLQGKNYQYRGRVEISKDKKAVRFTPFQKIPDQQELKFYLPASLKDLDGNILSNTAPIQVSTRFPQSMPKNTAKARDFYPKTNEMAEIPEHFRIIENFYKKGYIQNRNAQNMSANASKMSRYKIALLIEEAVYHQEKMQGREQGELKELVQDYEPELKNLGVDVEKILRSVSMNPGRQTNDFLGRGRQI